MANPTWSLTTIAAAGGPLACVELAGRLYRLETSLGRAGLAGMNSVAALFADWPRAAAALDALRPDPTDEVQEAPRLAPLLYPGKILCAGANYYDHCAEMGVADLRKEAQRLFFFMKPPRNAVVGGGATVRKPLDTKAMDWEVELAAVIGRTARAVSAEEALAHVAAYTVAIDFSARDLNRAPDTFYKLDWVAGKAHDTCCPMGPRLVPAAAIGDPQDLALRLSVNGAVKQDARTSGMIFSIAEQIATASRIMTLDPGDVILTGTPAGVGAPKGTFLAVGDRVVAEIEKIGTLDVTIVEGA
ncbi:MAG: fumarylacetoacetate hydrolase family protein [Rhodospirillales bacterium]|nr:fumarylacetoacetate hydrolase family protein [Rhodospirillales bacterium]